MVWRQLPKLVPAGSIPVSRSKKTEEQKLFRFCIVKRQPPAMREGKGSGSVAKKNLQ